VIEPEHDPDGAPTGFYFVTVGEGRRQAQLLRARRKEIRKTELVRCILDLMNDPHEISLDENVTRSDMHPADQFEAFKRLAEEKGWGPEEIGARFGVSAHTVRQRLRLASVSPRLIDLYRQGDLHLDQLIAFGVCDDHARQEQVYETLTWNRNPVLIRRAMTETKVPITDRRAVFVGVEAYAEGGGTVLRDLFTEDGGGWLEDVGLLDRLTAEKLHALASDIRDMEGWKWAEAHLDYPSRHDLSRVYPHKVDRSEAEGQRAKALAADYDRIIDQWAEAEGIPPEVEAQLRTMEAELAAHGEAYAFAPDEIARGGVFVILNQDGTARIERGLIRPEDLPPPEPAPEALTGDDPNSNDAELSGETPDEGAERDEDDDDLAPLSDRLIADLTAHRTAGLRDALAEHPDAALLMTVHALALRTFYPGATASCLDLRIASRPLGREADGIDDAPASRRIADRHEAWARQLPQMANEAWAFVVGLDGDSRMALLAHCVSLGVDAVHSWERRPLAWANADALATMVALDMSSDWLPSVAAYLGRVTKARILEAVREAVSPEAAERLAGLKKAEMAQAAEPMLAGSGWLPPPLRTASVATDEVVRLAAE
jgi:ParB family chromosome partitioning protein